MNKVQEVEKKHLTKKTINFKVGDTVRVSTRIVEEGKTRTQVFEGIVIGMKGCGTRESFTVRRISYGEGMERVFPLHSPLIEKVRVVRKGDVRRAKLNYLRGRVGKASKVDEKIERKKTE